MVIFKGKQENCIVWSQLNEEWSYVVDEFRAADVAESG